MNSIAVPDHVAVLVESVERSSRRLLPLGVEIGPAETFEGEGTREVYVERTRANALLLVEPLQDGAYRRALEKRGPGLHHLAVDVLDLGGFLASIAASGWLLHPRSVETMRHTRTAWLARPGFPALIEVQERSSITERPTFVTRVEAAIPGDLLRLLEPIGLDGTVIDSAEPALTLGGTRIPLRDLVAPSVTPRR